jgi:hypothetical protein
MPLILLVDSFTNEPLSHGFLRYHIAQKKDVPLGTKILNRAGIYFDFNPPVMTNYTEHEVGVITSATTALRPEPNDRWKKLQLSPNIIEAGTAFILAPDELRPGTRWQVRDASGQSRAVGRLNHNRNIQLPSSLVSGLYWVEFWEKEKPTGVAKLIVR